jgi:hypothetical protein
MLFDGKLHQKGSNMIKKIFSYLLQIILIVCLPAIGCKDNITNPSPPFPAGNYKVCYCGYGQIKTNNILGTDPENISLQDSNYKSGYYDDYPQWSPDGR